MNIICFSNQLFTLHCVSLRIEFNLAVSMDVVILYISVHTIHL
jgi:hypothetical protein